MSEAMTIGVVPLKVADTLSAVNAGAKTYSAS
jgi:hypothetical protein